MEMSKEGVESVPMPTPPPVQPAPTPQAPAPVPEVVAVPVAALQTMPSPVGSSHTGSWIVLSIALLLIGLVAGGAGGYYFGLQEGSVVSQGQVVPAPDTTQTTQTSVDTDTSASSSNPLNDVQLNPFQ